MKAAIEKRRRNMGQGGFTLIELLVVIAILAVLAGVVVFAVSGINDTSQESACTQDIRTLRTAVQAFRAQERVFPAVSGTNGQGALVDAGFLDQPSDWYAYTGTATSPAGVAVPQYARTSEGATVGCANP